MLYNFYYNFFLINNDSFIIAVSTVQAIMESRPAKEDRQVLQITVYPSEPYLLTWTWKTMHDLLLRSE